jgi:hypothetical protein
VPLFVAVEAALAAGQWVALAADYALGASFEPAVAAAPPGRPVLRAWAFAHAERLDAQALQAFLAGRLAAIPEEQRAAGIAELFASVQRRHAAQVRQVCRWIADGDCYQINLTFPLTFRSMVIRWRSMRACASASRFATAATSRSARRRFCPSRRSCFSSATARACGRDR